MAETPPRRLGAVRHRASSGFAGRALHGNSFSELFKNRHAERPHLRNSRNARHAGLHHGRRYDRGRFPAAVHPHGRAFLGFSGYMLWQTHNYA